MVLTISSYKQDNPKEVDWEEYINTFFISPWPGLPVQTRPSPQSEIINGNCTLKGVCFVFKVTDTQGILLKHWSMITF